MSGHMRVILGGRTLGLRNFMAGIRPHIIPFYMPTNLSLGITFDQARLM